jgi:3-hydroxyacyl-[acyl-carrier-protein] dehydratase
LAVGYKDVTEKEFWIPGHMPGFPLMPGVLICEAAAQLCCYYYCTNHRVDRGDFLAFGGMENVRFRGPVRPGDRLVLVAKVLKMTHRQVVCTAQGFVGATMVFHGDIIGVPFTHGERA